MSIVTLMIAIAFGSPPRLIDTRNVLQRFEDAKIQSQGRDPFAGTELCGALLSVRVPDDVYYVSLPVCGFDDVHLCLLRHFPNLVQVRCQRALTEVEHNLIKINVPRGTWLQYNVRLDDGTIDQRHTIRPGYRLANEDINGDGVIDENDEELDDATNDG